MRCNHFKRVVSVWACTSAIALLSGSAALAELPRHPIFQTLEATHDEIFPLPDEPPQGLYFGTATAIRDGIAFVGMPEAYERRGRVAIFTQTASGWQRTATLDPPPDVVSAGKFGQSLAFHDGYVMVGATNAVYVFKRSNGRWNLLQRLAAPTGEPDFAQTMHFESGVLVVGASYLGSDRRHGTAYVYERNAAGSFVLRASLVPNDSHIGDSFGWDVSVAGGVLVIGAPDFPTAGAAYVFRRNSSGVWVQRQRLTSSEGQAGDEFGWSVAIDKSMITIGAPNADVEGVPGSDSLYASGAVYGYLPVAGNFVESFKLRPRPDENPRYLSFGSNIAMFDKRIVVSAMGYNPTGIAAGYVHSYRRDGSTVTALGLASGFLQAEHNSVGLANQWLLVGSPYDFECSSFGDCLGNASLVDLTKFAQ